jgi:cysteinyl-tRNA synthetase
MAALGVSRPTFEPHARDYVDDVVALATALLGTGAAYTREGTVWFRGEDVPAAAGVEADHARTALEAEANEHGWAPVAPFDVPVWHPAGPGDPAWPSPWGPGRPGWHAECAAMALALLGPSVDVHAGGDDLAFPHHAYEAAMAEAATGVRPFARAWLHVGTVRLGGARMAKSTGNLVLVHDLLERWEPEVVRLLVLDRRYHEGWDFDEASLQGAADRFEGLWRAASRAEPSGAARSAVREALLDDLDVPRALSIAEEEGGGAVRELAGILGLVPSVPH